MALSEEERERFLAEPHVAAVAVARGDGQGPMVVPIWYGYEIGGEAWIDTEAESLKARKIKAAGRFSLMVDRVEPTPKYVSVEGPVTGVSPVSSAEHKEMAARYLSGAALEEYVQWFEGALGSMVRIRMRPERWLSADLGVPA
ncbi:pyridoxamine 5'-phosphate oxidase family protein [Hoyosella altamirensis]|uniref:Nitroimidazol reductase NimA-like FMN-containing flavoprotein (Pyridoxamine 5'-phosphate oxidase superfamily) n=1 Tax=Hoyosella altamirensis TaxID=616997 RepID=A0A839RIG1_9ACTN|nr:pyridoxamine 5'-phosphate oxidase family protein [Hoyosella altamirensis]MBB3036059.1 nitroimidazol reductase NimA-like FMN-containing flavoprotein (pyridoxamine 5'-phosphate oxidase superfamily) [Hoyosella altamirensis]